MYAILGDFKFKDYKGFQEFRIKDELALSEHAVIEGKPRLQATGDKLREITLKFVLHSTFSDPESDIEILNGYRRRAEIVPFLSGGGVSYGNFVIQSVETAAVQTDKKGGIINVEIEIVLLEAVTPDSEQKQTDKLAVKIPGIVIKGLLPRPSDAQLIAVNLKVINEHGSAILKELSFAQKVASAADRAFRTSKKRIDNIRTALVNIEKAGSQTQKIVASYNNMKGQAAQVSGATESLALFVNGGDLNSSVSASAQLRNSINKLNIDAAPVNNLVSVRRDTESPLAGGSDTFDFGLDGGFA